MIVNRDIINPNILFDGMTRDDLFKLINRWKRLLICEYDARKGQTLALAIITVNPNHIACIFAAAELGLKLLVITKPISHETIHATKMGIFGPVDITVSQGFAEDDPHSEMIEKYSRKICLEEEINHVTNDKDTATVDISPDDSLIFASTSGTTGTSKPVMFSHREVYEISKRNIDIFAFNNNSVVVHTKSFHHASGMLTFVIPALMVADKHFYGGISWIPVTMKTTYPPEEFVRKFIVTEKADMMLVNMPNAIIWLSEFIEKYKDQIHHKVKLNTSGFTIPERFYDYCKNLPLELYSHYGSVDTGIPLLVNHVTDKSEYHSGLLGMKMDNFYQMNDETVSCHLWEKPRPLPDKLRLDNGIYFYESRMEDKYIVPLPAGMSEIFNEQYGEHIVVASKDKPFLIVWNSEKSSDLHQTVAFGKTEINLMFKKILYLNKMDFMVDTKVSMEQLRAYLEHHYAV